ncbi:MAG: HupE/UreJ family protein [Pseudomonadota bacterium]
MHEPGDLPSEELERDRTGCAGTRMTLRRARPQCACAHLPETSPAGWLKGLFQMTSHRFRATFARIAIALVTFAAFAAPAAAHHPFEGMIPANWMQGMMSGLAHPVIDIDHAAMIIGVGLAAAISGSLILLPALFVGGSLIGCVLHLAGIGLPGAEVLIASSVLIVGLLVALAGRIPAVVWGTLAVVAGAFHGHAYGEGIFGAEPTPLVAYLIGFTAIQFVIACIAALIGSRIIAFSASDRAVQIAGAVVAGVGLTLIHGHLQPVVVSAITTALS